MFKTVLQLQKQIYMRCFMLFLLGVFCKAYTGYCQNVMKISSGTTFKTTGNVIITLQDVDLVTDGSILQLAGEGVFRFTGSTASSIGGTSIPLLNQVELQKQGVAVSIFNKPFV